jgi:hypothetical protein
LPSWRIPGNIEEQREREREREERDGVLQTLSEQMAVASPIVSEDARWRKKFWKRVGTPTNLQTAKKKKNHG